MCAVGELPDFNGAHAQIVFGLVGLLRLLAGKFLVLITTNDLMESS